jgi:hypothetical protein
MKIALVIVHNGTSLANSSKVSTLAGQVEYKTITVDVYKDSKLAKQVTRDCYVIPTLDIPHEVYVFQVVPYGKNPPANLTNLISRIVAYGQNDQDKTDIQPRFFNWAMSRAGEIAADLILYIDDLGSFTVSDLKTQLGLLTGKVKLIEKTWGKLISGDVLKIIGKLKEDSAVTDSWTDLKDRLVAAGYTYG